MIRAPTGNSTYWSERTAFLQDAIAKKIEMLCGPSINPGYDPQFAFDLAKYHLNLTLKRYSQGIPAFELSQEIAGILNAWELSNSLAKELNAQLEPGQGWDHRHLLSAPHISDDPRSHNDPRAWAFDLQDLNHYNWCFWLVGLGLALEIPEEQWSRLVALIGGEGQDMLRDRVIASRQSRRQIGTKLLHPKPYQRLRKAVDAPEDRRASLLLDFVDNWYPELARKGKMNSGGTPTATRSSILWRWAAISGAGVSKPSQQ